MYISQIFILSSRGDKIVYKDYRQDVPRNADEAFLRHVKFWGTSQAGDTGSTHQAVPGDCPPFFMDRGVAYSYIRKNGVYLVAASRHWDVSPLFVMECLVRLAKVLKDFLGIFSEDAIRKNFTLVYELMDEMIDSGVVQELGSERLRPYIFSEPVASLSESEKGSQSSSGGGGDSLVSRIRRGDFSFDKTRKSTATNVSIINTGKERKNEIYIDVIERLNVVFNAGGSVLTSEVDGTIIMKSFLAGSPELHLGLNEDLVVGSSNRNRYASVCLDSVNFHEGADYSRFESERTIVMRPPDGEFTVMNYRLTSEIPQPFRVVPSIELISTYKAEVTLRVRGDIPTTTAGINVVVRCPVPKSTNSVAVELGAGAVGQSHEFRSAEKTVLWAIQKFKGGTEHVVKIGIATQAPFTPAMRKEIGPVSMNFEVPSHNVSGISIRFLRLEERSKTYNPQRWVRNITQAASYVTRVS